MAMLATSTGGSHPRFVYRLRLRYARGVWTVTTAGELPDEHERRVYDTSIPAWDDYHGRILELEVHGYTRRAKVPPNTASGGCAIYAAGSNTSASPSSAPARRRAARFPPQVEILSREAGVGFGGGSVSRRYPYPPGGLERRRRVRRMRRRLRGSARGRRGFRLGSGER